MTTPIPTVSGFKTELYSPTKRTRVVVTDLAHCVRVTVSERRRSGRSYQVVDTQRFVHSTYRKLVSLAEKIVSEAA